MDKRQPMLLLLAALLASPALAADREGDALESRPASRAVPGPQEDDRDPDQSFIEAEQTRKTEERLSEEGEEPARRKQRLERRSGTRRDDKLEKERLKRERRRSREAGGVERGARD